MQKLHKTLTVNVPADKLLAILTDAAFENAKSKANGSIEAKVTEKSRSEAKLEYDITTTEYEVGITGVNKNKTENWIYHYKWDLKARTATWTLNHPMGGKVNISGNLKINEKGSDAELVNDMGIEVKIPLVGGKIEKKILSEVEAGWPKYDALVKEYVAK